MLPRNSILGCPWGLLYYASVLTGRIWGLLLPVCFSLCPSVPCGLSTRNQKGEQKPILAKTFPGQEYYVIDVPVLRSKVMLGSGLRSCRRTAA